MDIILTINNLTKIYKKGKAGEVVALKHVYLEVEKGDFVCLAGPSGSGKSTLLNIIGTLDTPTEGDVILKGVKLGTLSKSAMASLRLYNIGFVFQSYNLFPILSARENVEFPLQLQGISKKVRQEKAMEMLKDVGLEAMANRRPAELSGGQQQRVAVARALIGNPAIILGDEPTANLDGVTAQGLLDIMRRMGEKYNTTFIVSSHDERVIKHARRVVQLIDGQIVS